MGSGTQCGGDEEVHTWVWMVQGGGVVAEMAGLVELNPLGTASDWLTVKLWTRDR